MQIQESISVAVATAVIESLARLRVLVKIPSNDVISAGTAFSTLSTNILQRLRRAGELTSRLGFKVVATGSTTAVKELMTSGSGVVEIPTDGCGITIADVGVGWF